MNISKETRKKITKWIIAVATACILIYLGVKNIAVVSMAFSWILNLFFPLILGFGFALILNVPMRFFENHLFTKTKKPVLQKIRRPLAFIMSAILILGIVAGVVWLVIPEFIEAIRILIKNITMFVNQFVETQKDKGVLHGQLKELARKIEWRNIIREIESFIKNQGSNIVGTAVGTISTFVGGIVNFFFAVVFSIYILFGKEKLKAQCCRLIRVWIPESLGNWFVHSASVASKTFRNFVSGQTLEALILGVLCTIGMLILRIPYAPMIGALVGVMAVIPVVGAFIAVAIGAFMVFTVSPVKAVVFLVFFLLLQQFEGNIIYPRVMGSKINLPAIWILAAVTVGGALGGIPGMLLAVPATSTIYVLVREATENRELKIKETAEKETVKDESVETEVKN